MSQSLSIIVAIVVFIGIIFKYFIFRRESADEKPHHFFTSRILLEFTVDIIIIFMGHFISMGITQWDNDIKERENAVMTLEQACEFAQEQYNEIHRYVEKYESSDRKNVYQMELYTSLDLDYYDNVISNDVIIKHLSTHTYGIFSKYLKYLEVLESQIEEIDDKNTIVKHQMIKVRESFFGRLITILDICTLEASGKLSAEEYNKLKEIVETFNKENDQNLDRFDDASEYLIDRTLFKME